MRQSPKAKTPRNVDPKLTEEEARESFDRLFPDLPGGDVLADTVNRQKAREVDTFLARWLLADTWGRAYPPGAAQPVKHYHQQLMRMLELNAKLVGNLGAIESFMPENPVDVLCALFDADREQLAEIVGALRADRRLESSKEEDRVYECPPQQRSK